MGRRRGSGQQGQPAASSISNLLTEEQVRWLGIKLAEGGLSLPVEAFVSPQDDEQLLVARGARARNYFYVHENGQGFDVSADLPGEGDPDVRSLVESQFPAARVATSVWAKVATEEREVGEAAEALQCSESATPCSAASASAS